MKSDLRPTSTSIRFAAALTFGLAIGLTGCTVQAPSPALETVSRDLGWVRALETHAVADPNRSCVRSALQTGYALLALRDGGYDDRSIETALLQGATAAPVRRLRQSDIADWTRTHEPAVVAAGHLDRCLRNEGNEVIASDAYLRCVLATEPASMFSLYRRTMRTLGDAVRAVTPLYPINTDPGQIAELGRQVYGMPENADDIELREQIFFGCLRGAG